MSGHNVNQWQDGRCQMPEHPIDYILDHLLRYVDDATEQALREHMHRLGEQQSGRCGPGIPVINWSSKTNPRVTVSCDLRALPGACPKSATITAAQILQRFRERLTGEQLSLFDAVPA